MTVAMTRRVKQVSFVAALLAILAAALWLLSLKNTPSTSQYIEAHGKPNFVAKTAQVKSRHDGDDSLFGGTTVVLGGISPVMNPTVNREVLVYTSSSELLVYADAIMTGEFESSIGREAFFALGNDAKVTLVTVEGERILSGRTISAPFVEMSRSAN